MNVLNTVKSGYHVSLRRPGPKRDVVTQRHYTQRLHYIFYRTVGETTTFIGLDVISDVATVDRIQNISFLHAIKKVNVRIIFEEEWALPPVTVPGEFPTGSCSSSSLSNSMSLLVKVDRSGNVFFFSRNFFLKLKIRDPKFL